MGQRGRTLSGRRLGYHRHVEQASILLGPYWASQPGLFPRVSAEWLRGTAIRTGYCLRPRAVRCGSRFRRQGSAACPCRRTWRHLWRRPRLRRTPSRRSEQSGAFPGALSAHPRVGLGDLGDQSLLDLLDEIALVFGTVDDRQRLRDAVPV